MFVRGLFLVRSFSADDSRWNGHKFQRRPSTTNTLPNNTRLASKSKPALCSALVVRLNMACVPYLRTGTKCERFVYLNARPIQGTQRGSISKPKVAKRTLGLSPPCSSTPNGVSHPSQAWCGTPFGVRGVPVS